MTLNWGHKLLLAFVAFAGLIGYLVFRSIHTNSDLVTKEYYKDELVYQQVIDGSNRAGKLSSKVAVQQEGNTVAVQFPREMENTDIRGTILFYCAADAHKDREIPISTTAAAKQAIDAEEILPGLYTVKISWTAGGKAYYSQQDLIIHRQ